VVKKTALDKFVSDIYRLHSGTDIDFYKESIDSGFEYVCGALLRELRDPDIWYDGTGDLTMKKSDDGRLRFTGNMHVANGQTKFWQEKFEAIVHVKDNDKNFLIDVTCGDYEASGRIYSMFKDNME